MAGGRGLGASEDEDVDHYAVLCLPSGEEGAKLTLKEIEKAYRNQSRIRHPDKRPDDPNATADFQRLKTSFEVLKDETARGIFDARLRSRRERVIRDSFLDAKRRKLATDLEERERAAEAEDAADPAKQAERREKDVAARLQEELAEFRARKAQKPAASTSTFQTPAQERKEEPSGVALDKERMLKVSWERDLGEYTSAKLRELFGSFGGVEDVVIRSKGSRKKGSAIIVMSSKDAAYSSGPDGKRTRNGRRSTAPGRMAEGGSRRWRKLRLKHNEASAAASIEVSSSGELQVAVEASIEASDGAVGSFCCSPAAVRYVRYGRTGPAAHRT